MPDEKKPTFADRVRTKLQRAAEDVLADIPEVDAVTFVVTYRQALGDIDPSALIVSRDTQDPMLRAQIAHDVGQLGLFATKTVVAGFQEALATLQELTKEIDARRNEAAKTGTDQDKATS